MGKIKRFGLVVVIAVVINFVLSFSAHATATFNLPCPEKYIVKVDGVLEIEAPLILPKIEVNFQILQTIKGEKIFSKKIQVVKNGPINFKNGETYSIELNNGWLCSATSISKL